MPLVWYEGSGSTTRYGLTSDRLGSVTGITTDAGALSAVNSYDEYGIGGTANAGRYQYTGQKWLTEIGLYDYKARIYSPTLGRFMQPDPIGYGDGINFYQYVHSDPVNGWDPSGMDPCQYSVSYVDADGLDNIEGPFAPCPFTGFLPGSGGGISSVGGGGFGPGSGSSGGTPTLTTPPNNQKEKSSDCHRAESALASAGERLEKQGDLIQLGGVAGAILSVGTSEFGGEVLFEPSVQVVELGSVISNVGAGVKGYARGGVVGAGGALGASLLIDSTRLGILSQIPGIKQAEASILNSLVGQAKDALKNAILACGG